MVSIDKERLIKQLKSDEGFSPKAYWDIKQYTYGYGTKAPSADATITEEEASDALAFRVEQSIKEFYSMFPGSLQDKFNAVRAEAFINMLFNMGMGKDNGKGGGLKSFKNTLSLIYDYLEVNWSAVAYALSLSLWHRQVGKRAERIEKEIRIGEKA